MTESVDLGGTELRVTPASEVPFPMNLVVGMIGGRMVRKLEESENAADIEPDMYELLEICVEDGIRQETIQELDPEELATILDVVFEDPNMAESEVGEQL